MGGLLPGASEAAGEPGLMKAVGSARGTPHNGGDAGRHRGMPGAVLHAGRVSHVRVWVGVRAGPVQRLLCWVRLRGRARGRLQLIDVGLLCNLPIAMAQVRPFLRA